MARDCRMGWDGVEEEGEKREGAREDWVSVLHPSIHRK